MEKSLKQGKHLRCQVITAFIFSDKNDKTVVVRVERRFAHPLLQKTVRRSKKYKAHDEQNTVKTGDIVSIEECAPISKDKRWRVVQVHQ